MRNKPPRPPHTHLLRRVEEHVLDGVRQARHLIGVEQAAGAHVDGGGGLVGLRVGHEARAQAVRQIDNAVSELVAARLDDVGRLALRRGGARGWRRRQRGGGLIRGGARRRRRRCARGRHRCRGRWCVGAAAAAGEGSWMEVQARSKAYSSDQDRDCDQDQRRGCCWTCCCFGAVQSKETRSTAHVRARRRRKLNEWKTALCGLFVRAQTHYWRGCLSNLRERRSKSAARGERRAAGPRNAAPPARCSAVREPRRPTAPRPSPFLCLCCSFLTRLHMER